MKCHLLIVGASLLTIAYAQTSKQCAEEVSVKCPPPGVGAEPEFFPVPEHCSQYCECSNGVAWLFDCPDGTLWNLETEQCLLSYDVDCYPRPIP